MEKAHPACDVCRGIEFSKYRGGNAAGRELLRCLVCGVVAASPGLGSDRAAASGSEEGRESGEERRDPRMDRRRAAAVMRLIEGGRVLEMGCGPGHFLSALDPVRFKTTGLPGAPGSAALPQGHEESFDIVALFGGLGQAASPRATMMEVCRLLKPGGLAVIETPCVSSLTARLCGTRWEPLANPRAAWFFSGASLDRLAVTCGMVPFSSRTAFLTSWPQPGHLFHVARKSSETVRGELFAGVAAGTVRTQPIGATR